MREFKGVQKDILLANKKNQLVSAGAGSGKTTVMIEKISNLLIKQNVDVDNLLVVTFTVLAAQEMKDRLIKNLKNEIASADETEKERILKIVEKIKTASIDTIDGFSSKTIKKYFYDLEISPNIEILSDATKDYYLTKAMTKTFNDYSKSNDDINFVLDLFGGNSRNLDALKQMVLTAYYNIINIEDYENFLAQAEGEYLDSIKSEQVVNQYICELVSKLMVKIQHEFSVFTSKVQDKLKVFVEELSGFNLSFSFKTNLKYLNSLEVVKFTPTDFKENEGLKSLSGNIADLFAIKSNLEKNQIDENFDINNRKIVKYLTIFINLLKNFIKNYTKIKEKNNLIDFNDLNRLMLKLLNNDNIRKELQDKYRYIFVDEYQDVNPLQDKLMTLLTGENTTVFMVGDVKQSIYGFRGSSPEWFLNKYNKMKQNQQCEDVFDMNINFRSSPTILNFINELFSVLMTKEIADIDYKKDCMIEPQRDDIIDDKVQIMFVEDTQESEHIEGLYSVKNHEQNKTVNSKDKESMLVLNIITGLIGKEFYDANLKERRKLTYKDIAILTHSDKDESACNLIDMLKSHAVPVGRNNKLDINASEIVRLILSIIKCVILTADDVDYLAAFMALTDLTMDNVVSIRNKEFTFYENLLCNQENEEVKKGFEVLNDLKQASFSSTNKELIYRILNQHKLRYHILQKPNGEKELMLLEEFIAKLSPLEDALGLAEFVEMVESNVDSSSDFTTVDREDCVTIQTIHKSKGLEYPVVILFNSSKLFAYLRENDAVNFNSNIGFGFDYFDIPNRVKMDSLTKFAIRLSNNKKGYKEELRLLYVALTRAKNKLFITGTYKPKDFEDINKTSYTNMILSCFGEQIQGDTLEKNTFKLSLLQDVEFGGGLNEDETIEFESVGEDFKYADKSKFNIPFKNTVTGINSKHNETEGYDVKQIMSRTVQYNVEDRAQIGVNYHSALEKLDLEAKYKQNTDFEKVDYLKIKKAYEVLHPLVKDAVSIEKEAEFMMYIPHNEVVSSGVEDKVLIQGVVDLIIERENTIDIVDYKFSSLPIMVLKERYGEQLKLYKKAVESAYNKKVENMFIYSINTGELA